MSPNENLDLDYTSQTHINRALKRAEMDCCFFRPRLLANSKGTLSSLRDIERDKNLQNTVRISWYDYSSLIGHARLITNKEIRSSVSRSRRWAGRQRSTESCDTIGNPRLTNRSAVSRTASLKTAPVYSCGDYKSLCVKAEKKHKKKTTSAESDYHQTICNIIANRRGTSSYAHVAKALNKKSTSAKVSTLTSSIPYSDKFNSLPPLSMDKNKMMSPNSVKTQIDITLPSVFYNNIPFPITCSSKLVEKCDSELLPESNNSYCVPKNAATASFEKLSMTKLYDALLNDDNEKCETSSSKMATGSKRQAKRAIASYYDRKPNQDNKILIVRIPNANTTLKSFHQQKRTPRLFLRNASSAMNSKTTKPIVNIVRSSQAAVAPEATQCFTTINCVNIRPFLTN